MHCSTIPQNPHSEVNTTIYATEAPSCFEFELLRTQPCMSGQNNLSSHSERGKKTRRMEEEVGRPHQGMDRPGICHGPEGSGEQRRIAEIDCEVICGAPTAPAVN